MNRNFSQYSTFRNQLPITMDQVRSLAPSAFAAEAHESRSARYTYIPTSAVIEGMMKEGFQPYSASQSNARTEDKASHTKHMIRFRQASDVALTVGDSLPEIILVNSHDGSSAYEIIAGIYRLICMNGLAVDNGTLGSLHIAHKGDVVSKVIEGSIEILDRTDRILDTVKQWQSLQLTSGEQSAYANAVHSLRFDDADRGTAKAIEPARMLDARRSDDKGNDLWRVFNRAQENALRGGLRGHRVEPGKPTRRVKTRAVNGITQNIGLNRALWQITAFFAEQKSAA